jgi:type II secretory pathway component GspD/PulD (secretin)
MRTRRPVRSRPGLVLTAVLAVAAFAAAAAAARADETAPFPVTDRYLTIGEFLEIVSGPDCLDVNLVVKPQVDRKKTLGYTFQRMTCREALDLVLSLESLRSVPFRPGVVVITTTTDRAGPLAVAQRSFTLAHATPDRIIAYIRASRALAAEIDADRLTAAPDGRTLVAIDDPRGLAAVARVVAELDVPRSGPTVVIELSHVTFEELQAAMRRLGPDATGGLGPDAIVYLSARRAIAVSATPDQVARLRALIRELDVPPESVQIGVTSAGLTRDASAESGLEVNDISFPVLPGRPRPIGGRVAYARNRARTATTGTLWVTTLSGSPARFSVGQIFNVQIPSTVIGQGGAVAVGANVQEVPVGQTLEVLPIVRGRLVSVEVRLLDETPTQISSFGVDRSTRNLIARAMLARGQSMQIGGIAQSLADRRVAGFGELLRSHRDRQQDLAVVLTVR